MVKIKIGTLEVSAGANDKWRDLSGFSNLTSLKIQHVRRLRK